MNFITLALCFQFLLSIWPKTNVIYNITVKLEEDPLILMKGTQQNNIKCICIRSAAVRGIDFCIKFVKS